MDSAQIPELALGDRRRSAGGVSFDGDPGKRDRTDVSARRPCLDVGRAQDAAFAIAASFDVAETSGWLISLACGDQCWRGQDAGAWEPVATAYQGGRSYRREAMVIVDPSRPGIAPSPSTGIRTESGSMDGDRLASGIVAAFTSVPGMLVVALGPDRSIIADPGVSCSAARMDGQKLLVVDFKVDGRPVIWPGRLDAEALIRNDRDPCSWQETTLAAMELCLEAGHLTRLKHFLSTDAAGELLASNDPIDAARTAAIRAGLAAAELEEAAAGGRGSLKDHLHPFSRWLVTNELVRERLNRRTKWTD